MYAYIRALQKDHVKMELKHKFIFSAKNLKYTYSVFIICISMNFWKGIYSTHTFRHINI